MKAFKYAFSLVALLISSNKNICAQISKGGVPQSFSIDGLHDSISVVNMPTVNADSLILTDVLTTSNSLTQEEEDKPFRFGYAIDVNMGLQNSGTWDTLSNGDKIWRLKIHSTNAFSINLIYDNYWLPEGAHFFVYNEDKSMVLGAFTSDVSNNTYNKFATDLIKGNACILEYYEPSYAIGGIINIDKVIHGYKDMFYSNEQSDGLGEASSCNIDVNCSQGDSWCIEKRAVSMILVDDNTAACSGCLINNVRQDLTPYYLTANHCLSGSSNTWIFRFKYWRPTCSGADPNHWVSITGSTIKANYSGSDFALLQLSSKPPSGFGVFYAGWYNQNVASTSGVSITHPRGDAMKIALYNQTTTQQTYLGSSDWDVKWSQGTVEPGSSGGPLFNNNHQIIGQVHGGNPPDICTSNDHAYFGRFDVSWTGGGTSSTRLSDWLDPDNTGLTSIGATSPTIYLINRYLTGTNSFAALDTMHVEGNVTTTGSLCQTSNTPFTAESGSNITMKAEVVSIRPGVEFKAGSNVTVTATNTIQCSDVIVEGDYVDAFCYAQVTKKLTVPNGTNTDQGIDKLKVSDNITIYPNPNNGQFEIEFSDNSLKTSEIIIYDGAGKIVYEQISVTENKIGIELNNFVKGIYLVQIINNNNSYTKRIVVQ